MNAAAPAVRSDEPVPMVQLRKQLEDRAEEFRMVLPDHISPAKFQRTLLTAVQLNPDLLNCDRRSFLTSCMKAAQDALLPDGREAAIVPFKTRVKDPERGWTEVRLAQYLPMTFGLRKKILQSAEVVDLFANVVYDQELKSGCFHYEEGSERALRHRPILDPDFRPTDADIVLAYSVATFADGTKSFEVMRRWQIEEVREASQTGAAFDKKGNAREPKGPWVGWFAEMAKKTVIRRHSKSLPQSGDVIVRDIESEDMGLAAAKATVALLDSRPGEAPRSLGDQADQGFDPETGEIDTRTLADVPSGGPDHIEPEIVAEGFDPGTERLKAKVEAAAAANAGTPTPERERKPEPSTPPSPESEPQPNDAEFSEEEGVEEPGELTDEALADPEFAEPTDELGVTRDDDEALAEGYAARAKACETIIDLRNLEKEAELDLALMEPEFAMAVDKAFANARKRLTPAKAKAS